MAASGNSLGLDAFRARFAIGYVTIAGALFTLYCLPYRELGVSERWFRLYLSGYAQLAGAVLGLFEHGVSVSGTAILGRYPLQIVKNCDAIEIEILLASAILAVPRVPLRKRAVAAALAVLSVIAVNVFRIVSLYFVGVYWPQAFERLHLEIWPLLLVAFASSEFLYVSRRLAPEPRPDVALRVQTES